MHEYQIYKETKSKKNQPSCPVKTFGKSDDRTEEASSNKKEPAIKKSVQVSKREKAKMDNDEKQENIKAS